MAEARTLPALSTYSTPHTIAIADHSRPFYNLGLIIPRGALHDPHDKAGLAYLTAQMLVRGAAHLSRPEFAEAIDHLGASLDLTVSRDHTTLWADGLTRNREDLLTLVDYALREPTFPASELDKLRRETLAELIAVRDDDASLGMRFFAQQLYGTHAYGRPLKGSPASLARISRDDLAAFHRTFTRDGALIGLSGDTPTPPDALSERLLSLLAPSAPAAQPVAAPAPTQSGWHIRLVDKPERSQTQVFLGHLTIDANHPDWTALQVGQTTFGGTFTSRFSQEIREKRGWSYGAYSQLSGDQRLGTFLLRFYPSSKDTAPALAVTDELLTAFCESGPDKSEHDAAQSYLQNGFVFSVDTPSRRLSELMSARLLGYPDTWLDETISRYAAVTHEDAIAAVKRHLRPDDLAITIVGTAKDLEPALRALPRVRSIEVVDWQIDID